MLDSFNLDLKEKAVKTRPTSIKEKRIPRAEVPCITFTKRTKEVRFYCYIRLQGQLSGSTEAYNQTWPNMLNSQNLHRREKAHQLARKKYVNGDQEVTSSSPCLILEASSQTSRPRPFSLITLATLMRTRQNEHEASKEARWLYECQDQAL
eukprot:1161021-Pelagomonas_calceolata.AAC.11